MSCGRGENQLVRHEDVPHSAPNLPITFLIRYCIQCCKFQLSIELHISCSNLCFSKFRTTGAALFFSSGRANSSNKQAGPWHDRTARAASLKTQRSYPWDIQKIFRRDNALAKLVRGDSLATRRKRSPGATPGRGKLAARPKPAFPSRGGERIGGRSSPWHLIRRRRHGGPN